MKTILWLVCAVIVCGCQSAAQKQAQLQSREQAAYNARQNAIKAWTLTPEQQKQYNADMSVMEAQQALAAIQQQQIQMQRQQAVNQAVQRGLNNMQENLYRQNEINAYNTRTMVNSFQGLGPSDPTQYLPKTQTGTYYLPNGQVVPYYGTISP